MDASRGGITGCGGNNYLKVELSLPVRPPFFRDCATVKIRHNMAALHSAKLKQFGANRFCVTLCRHRGAPQIIENSLQYNASR